MKLTTAYAALASLAPIAFSSAIPVDGSQPKTPDSILNAQAAGGSCGYWTAFPLPTEQYPFIPTEDCLNLRNIEYWSPSDRLFDNVKPNFSLRARYQDCGFFTAKDDGNDPDPLVIGSTDIIRVIDWVTKHYNKSDNTYPSNGVIRCNERGSATERGAQWMLMKPSA